MKQILRTIDGWRFEAPLALALGAAACFAVVAMPQPTFGHVPVAGGLGAAGRMVLAVTAALLLGGIGYLAMRQAGRPKAPRVEPEFVDEDYDPEPVSPERLARFRRADSHPDAPQREPIVASRDLGTPFMEAPVFEPARRSWEPPLVPEGDFAEIEQADEESLIHPTPAAAAAPGEEAAAAETPLDLPSFLVQSDPEAPHVAEPVAEAASPAPVAESHAFDTPVVETPVLETPVPAAVTVSIAVPPKPTRESLGAMMDRLSAGLQRRAAEPPAAPVTPVERDVRPALREALDELNRLAARRH